VQNTSVQRLEGGTPITGLPRGRLVNRPRELSITFKPQCEANRTANLKTNYNKKTFLIITKFSKVLLQMCLPLHVKYHYSFGNLMKLGFS